MEWQGSYQVTSVPAGCPSGGGIGRQISSKARRQRRGQSHIEGQAGSPSPQTSASVTAVGCGAQGDALGIFHSFHSCTLPPPHPTPAAAIHRYVHESQNVPPVAGGAYASDVVSDLPPAYARRHGTGGVSLGRG